MKKNQIILIISLLMFSWVHAQSQTAHVRPTIGVNGVKPQTKLTPDETSANMTVENQKWSPEKDRPYIVRATGKEVTGLTWKEYSFSFTPDKDGYVWLSLEGQYPPKEAPKIVFKVDYDNVVVTGGSIENGDFETLDENGKAKFWTYAGEVIPQGSAPALLGTHFVTATANNRVGVALKGIAGQKVTVTFNARMHVD